MTTPNKKGDALGKGIRSLLQSIDADLKTTSGELKTSVVEAVTNMLRVPLDQVETNPRQPRHDFDEQALQELAHSIKLHDIIQPVTISKLPSGKYRLISGERRFRAAKIAGLKDIPAYVRQADDQQLLELALLENLQREDLNAMEISLSYKRMMEELNYTQEQVAESGSSTGHVASATPKAVQHETSPLKVGPPPPSLLPPFLSPLPAKLTTVPKYARPPANIYNG